MKGNRKYICATCNGPVTRNDRTNHPGLGTFRCPKHPFRYVTVSKDMSGGKEADRGHRSEPVTVKRHTAVKVVYERVK